MNLESADLALLSWVFHRKGDLRRASSVINKAIRMDPAPHFYEQRAHLYLDRNLPKKALADACSALQNASSFTAYAMRGHIYKQLGQWEAAEKDFETARGGLADGRAWQECLGRMHLKQGAFQEPLISSQERRTLKKLSHLIEKRPGFWPLLWRAELLLRMDRIAEAISDFKQATRIQPRHPWGWISLGGAQWTSGEYRAALKSLELYGKLSNSPHPRSLIWQAECRFFTGDSKGAEKDFNEAVRLCEIEEDIQEILPWRATFFLWTGRYQQALQDCEAALKINPRAPYALCWKGAALFKLGRSIEALKVLETAWEADPHNNETLVWRVEILRHLGRTREALKVMKSMVCHCDPRIWLWLNEVLIFSKQNRRQALAAIRRFPAYPSLSLFLDEIASRMKLGQKYRENVDLFAAAAEKALAISLGNRVHPPSIYYFRNLKKARSAFFTH